MRLGEGMAPPEVQVIPSGSLGLDIALGVGGLPRGRIMEVYGPESSGKTTLALHVVGEAQKLGGICAFVDAEHALDVGYARKLGVRTDDLLVSQPDCGEQALEITEMLVRSGAVDIVVVDSVAALTPRAELEGRDGRLARRPAGAAHEPGAAQADRHHLQVEHAGHLHQPDPDEDRRHVRQPRDDDRRQRAQVLRQRAARHPPRRRAQGRRQGGRQPDAREGGEEQDGAAVPRGRVRHPLRRGDQPRGRSRRPRRRVRRESRSRAPGSASRAIASARGARTPSSTCATTPTWPARSR